MKTSGWIASGIGAVVLVGGGIWGVNALTASDDGTVTAVEETQAPTETPEPVETATVEPDESETPVAATGPIEVSAAPSEEPVLTGEDLMREYISSGFWWYVDASDEEILSLAYYVCDERYAGVPQSEIVALTGDGITDVQNADFVTEALRTLCP